MRKFFVAAAVAVLGLFGTAPSADAAFAARFTTLSNPGGTTITDGGAGDLDGVVNNQIIAVYGDASYNLIGTISFTNAPGTPNLGIVDVSYNINTLGTTGGLATLEVSATGFTEPSFNPLTLTSTVNGNGNGTGTITLQQYANTADVLFGQGPITPGLQGPFAIGAVGGYSSTASTQFNQVGAYSITDVLTFDLGANSNTSGDSQSVVTPAPAPAGLVLALSAVPMLGIGRWLRRRRTSI